MFIIEGLCEAKHKPQRSLLHKLQIATLPIWQQYALIDVLIISVKLHFWKG